MPEGDSIVRFARRLRPDLEGQRITHLRLRHRGTLDSAKGLLLTTVTTHGKHTLIHYNGCALHIHLGMNGNWQRRASGSSIPQGQNQPSAVIETQLAQWRCHQPMRAEVLEGGAIRVHPSLVDLGPCLLASELDIDEVVSRARRAQHRRSPIADLLLVQSVAAGIGTIYRSEALFVARQSPWTPVAALRDERIGEIYTIARRLLGEGVEGTRKAGDNQGKLRLASRRAQPTNWVYTRSGHPCWVCGQTVEVRRHSDQGRKTYYCRRCQIDEPRKQKRHLANR